MKHFYALLWALFLVTSATAQTVGGTSASRRIVWQPAVPTPTAPAKLLIENIALHDLTANGMIDAGERFTIHFTVRNAGEGQAYVLTPKAECNSSDILIDPPTTIPALAPGDSCAVEIQGRASAQMADNNLEFKLTVGEGNGFTARGESLRVRSYGFRPPRVVITQTRFSTRNGGTPQVGEPITMQLLVANQGESAAEAVALNVQLPANVFLGENSTIEVGHMNAGEQRIIEFPFFTNARYINPAVEIRVELKESYNAYGEKRAFNVDLQKSMDKASPIIIAPAAPTIQTPATDISLFSDVDINIPKNDVAAPHLFALVIGNERYSTSNGEANVPFARADAQVFSQYLENTFGVPKDNIVQLFDGTKVAIENAIQKVITLAQTYPTSNAAAPEIIIYYAGHGFYDNERNGYIMPVDVRATQVEYAVKMTDLYNRLSRLDNTRVTMFLDACFSGGARAEQMLAARAVKIEPNKDVIAGKLVVFTATQSDQTAHAYRQKQHGMFTYFLLKKLQKSAGRLTYGELYEFLSQTVNHNSVKYNDTQQQPGVLCSFEIDGQWSDWKFVNN